MQTPKIEDRTAFEKKLKAISKPLFDQSKLLILNNLKRVLKPALVTALASGACPICKGGFAEKEIYLDSFLAEAVESILSRTFPLDQPTGPLEANHVVQEKLTGGGQVHAFRRD